MQNFLQKNWFVLKINIPCSLIKTTLLKALLITSKEEDYLQDSVIHGFKMLYGKEAVDYPCKEILYDDFISKEQIRGNGFTLYGLLPAALKPGFDVDIFKSLKENQFDLVVFTSIYRQFELFYEIAGLLLNSKCSVWIIDGEDTPLLFPYNGRHLIKFFDAIKPHHHFRYFKRELMPESLDGIYYGLPVSRIINLRFPKNITPIAFSIPEEKIIGHLPAKTKTFTSHIVDNEVARNIYGLKEIPVFNKEEDYYQDIRASRFGVTTKRGGWDCLRHYEIAANGAVICFRELGQKPVSCAPHGLVTGENCLVYSGYSDLSDKINKLTDVQYTSIQTNGINWCKQNSTISRIRSLIRNYAPELCEMDNEVCNH